MTTNFKREKIHDKEHLAWIRKQNCYLCGCPPTKRRITPHHAGDGLSTKRSRDDITLPLCFGWCNEQGKPLGCHRYVEDHGGEFNIEQLRKDAKGYWDRHNEERKGKDDQTN